MRNNPSIVRLKDIAARCGVTPMLVSWALRGDRRNVSAATMARIRAAAAEMGYNPAHAHAARRLRYTRSDSAVANQLVGLYLSLRHFQGPYFQRLLSGLGQVLDAAGVALLTNWTPADQSPPRCLPPVFARGDVDGVLTMSGVPHIERLVSLLRAEPGFDSRPVVGMLEPAAGCSSVLVDDAKGGYLLMSHLLDQGHRCMVYVKFHNWQSQQRIEGCCQACRDRGLDPRLAVSPVPYRTEDTAWSRANLYRELRRRPDCRAVFAGNDMTACRVADWLHQVGLRVPEHVSLIGFDDIPIEGFAGAHLLAGPDGRPRLTTVRLPLEEIGRTAAGLLLQHVRGEATSPRTILLPVELMVRGSTAAPSRAPLAFSAAAAPDARQRASRRRKQP